MSGVYELHKMLREGLEMQAAPGDATFSEMWEMFANITNLAGCRLMETRMGASLDAAEEVRLYLARFDRVTVVSRGMPLLVPAPAIRGMRALGRLLEDTRQVEDLGAFVRLSTPLVNDYAGYAARELGRFSRPVVHGLTVVARAGALMSECVHRAVPALAELEEER